MAGIRLGHGFKINDPTQQLCYVQASLPRSERDCSVWGKVRKLKTNRKPLKTVDNGTLWTDFKGLLRYVRFILAPSQKQKYLK